MTRFKPIEYIKIAIANHYGLDKLSWQERIEWTDSHTTDELLGLVNSGKAEEPAEMLGAVMALIKANKHEKVSFLVGLDATCSCLQLTAALTNDIDGMKQCNVIGTGKREDSYSNVLIHMNKHLEKPNEHPRGDVKQAVMTSVYGSKKKPMEIFGEETPEYYQFLDSMNKLFPRVWKLNSIMLSHWNPKADEYSWVMPDNFHVKIDVETIEELKATFDGHTEYFTRKVKGATPTGRCLGANMIHSVDVYTLREMIRRTNYDPNWVASIRTMKLTSITEEQELCDESVKMVRTLLKHYENTGLISQRIVDYIRPHTIGMIPAELLEKVLSRFSPKPFETLTIHDCFRVHPNYANEIRRQYVELLAELSESSLLDSICWQINKFKPHFRKERNIAKLIRETSDYALS